MFKKSHRGSIQSSLQTSSCYQQTTQVSNRNSLATCDYRDSKSILQQSPGERLQYSKKSERIVQDRDYKPANIIYNKVIKSKVHLKDPSPLKKRGIIPGSVR